MSRSRHPRNRNHGALGYKRWRRRNIPITPRQARDDERGRYDLAMFEQGERVLQDGARWYRFDRVRASLWPRRWKRKLRGERSAASGTSSSSA